jgi:glycosidase
MRHSISWASSSLLIAGGLALAASIIATGCGGANSVEHPWDRPHQVNADIDWRDQVIYQIMIDRFSNGDPNNDYNVEPNVPGRYHGGDWQGVIDNLDYLEGLGVTTLWISPVVKNTEEDAGFGSYHGYWTYDFLRTNPHFGDLIKLREMVDAAHERGMLVILDVVTNHVGQLFYYDINGNGRPDDWLSGGGTSHTCVQKCSQDPCGCYRDDDPRYDAGSCPRPVSCTCSGDEHRYCIEGASYLERIIEWDPEYDPRGIQGWSSLGFSGDAQIVFTDWPEVNRTVPPRPPAWFEWPADKPWFDDPSWYNRRGRVYTWWHESSYTKEFVREQEIYGDFPGGLKDLNTDDLDVQDAMVEIFSYWIDVADFDGFRIDTAKHIDRPELDPNVRGFWGEFLTRIRAHVASIGKQNFFIFGEAFDGNDQLIGSYTFGGTDDRGPFSRFDSVFYFSQYYSVIEPVFKRGAPTRNIECLFNQRMGMDCSGAPQSPTYQATPHATPAEGGIGLAPQKVLVNFLDNHDLPRFLFEGGTVPMLQNALFFLMTWDGIPCLYYGTEQLFAGGVDPRNREDMWRGNEARGFAPFATDHEQFQLVSALIQMRKDNPALRRGETAILWSTDRPRGDRDSGIFAFERTTAEQRAVVVVNTADDQDSTTCAPVALGGACMQTGFSQGTVLRNVAPGNMGETYTVGAAGALEVTVPARGGMLLVP